MLRSVDSDCPERDISEDANTPIEEISFTLGDVDTFQKQAALYAFRETLVEATDFVAQYDFSTTFFSARITPQGFVGQPKLHLTKAVKKSKFTPWPSLAAAIVAIGAISMVYSSAKSTSVPTPEIQGSLTPKPLPLAQPVQQPVASVMKASSVQVSEPFVSIDTFDAKDLDILANSIDAQTKLSPLSNSSEPFLAVQKLSPIEKMDWAQPQLVSSSHSALALDHLSANATVPKFPDNITAPNTPELTDAAVPEDANYPPPKLRDGNRTTPVVTLPPAAPSNVARPPRRPANLRSKAATSAKTTEAAIAQDLVQQAIIDDASTAQTQLAASSLASGTDKRPPKKTSNFRDIVKRAKSKPSVTVSTTTVSVDKPATKTAPDTDKATRASTTFSKSALSLVGIFGAPSKRSALFRTSTGGYRSVKVGQRIAGWKVVSISESEARVTKGSRTKTMRVP